MACRLVGAKPLSEPMWNIINWTLRNKVQWNFNRNSWSFIQENAFERVVCEMTAILSRPQCVKEPVHQQAWYWPNKLECSISSIRTDNLQPIGQWVNCDGYTNLIIVQKFPKLFVLKIFLSDWTFYRKFANKMDLTFTASCHMRVCTMKWFQQSSINDIEGLEWDCGISSVSAMEISLSCIESSMRY